MRIIPSTESLTCLGGVGSVVHDGRKYIFSHHSSPLLVHISVDKLGLETPGEPNNLIKLLLPHVVM